MRDDQPRSVSCYQPALAIRVEVLDLEQAGISEFNDIIADMDADVITFETSRSDMQLLDAFDDFDYPNQIDLGVYAIHSPNIPGEAQMVKLMRKAAERIPPQRLWVNPDCGLKTRGWKEVPPALANMVAAANNLRADTQV